MIPVKISLEGFMTYRDKQTLSFDGSSLCILAGPNGAGKSSVFDAITLALYNCHRAGKKNARALINHGADRLIVEFDFQVGDELYRVRRTVPRKGAATRQAYYLRSGESSGSVSPVPDTQYEDGFEQWIESTIGLKYETFISSVLLLQGQSTKLLDAAPKERHQMLEEFVNLAAYKRLHELADDQRKQLTEKLKDLGKQLQISSLLSEDDLTQSEATLQVANDHWEAAQQAMDQLTAVLEQSKHWNIRREEIDQHEKKLQQLQQLLEQSAEIQEQHDRYQILNLVLPQLRSILDSRGRLDRDTRKITQMTEEVRELKAALEKSTESHKAQHEQKTQLEKQFRKLTQEQTAIAHQIAELAPQIAQLSQLKEAEKELEDLAQKLQIYPADLTALVDQAEIEEKTLLEAKQSLPFLRQLSDARSGLSEVLQTGTQTSEQLKQLENKLIELKAKEKEIGSEFNQAEQAEKDCFAQVIHAQKNYDDFYKKIKGFETAAQQSICDLCGQEITPEHVEKEYRRLNTESEQARSFLEYLKPQQQQAQQAKQDIMAQQSLCKQEIARLQQEIHDHGQQREQLLKEFVRYKKQFREAYDNLAEVYQSRIGIDLSNDHQDWLVTSYPTQQDLNDIQASTKQLSSLNLKLKQLREQLGKRNQLETTQQQTRDRLSRIRDTLPLEHSQLQPENDRLQQNRKELEQELDRVTLEQDESERQFIASDTQLRKLEQQLQQQQLELATTEAGQAEVQRSLNTATQDLPVIWQEQVQTLDPLSFETLKQEHSDLQKYCDLRQQLDLAERSILEEEQTISQLNAELEKTLPQAQCPYEEIEAKLAAAKGQRENLQIQRDQARQAWQEMQQDYSRQTRLQQEHKETEYQQKLYVILSKLLGPSYLQAHLLQQAETRIVELANETLDGLSRGRLRLELQGNKAKTGEAAKQALDLVVYDVETGGFPVAIAVTSGSQRFRIAVSLALAIGRYAGQETHGIKSVIIDEGFGGLDKQGRDDMIYHLGELQQHLARIVLVSHQEEFASAFTNGYQIQLMNGASQVQPLNFMS
jgi:DNA repair protein SbcC/Rad50